MIFILSRAFGKWSRQKLTQAKKLENFLKINSGYNLSYQKSKKVKLLQKIFHFQIYEIVYDVVKKWDPGRIKYACMQRNAYGVPYVILSMHQCTGWDKDHGVVSKAVGMRFTTIASNRVEFDFAVQKSIKL